MNKEYSTLQLVLNGQKTLLDSKKLVTSTLEIPDVKCMDPNQIYWASKMENQGERMPLVQIGNSCTCSILLNTNY